MARKINTGDDSKDLLEAKKIEQLYINKYIPGKRLYNRSYSSETGTLMGEDHHNYLKTPQEWMGKAYEEMIKNRDYNGKNNPFYKREHNQETIDVLKTKCAAYGENNSFYGKSHSEETNKKISQNRKGFRSRELLINGKYYESISKVLTELLFGGKKLRKSLDDQNNKDYLYLN